MKSFLIYLFQSGLCLVVFYLVYELFLKRETFFQLNRIYLVSGLGLSFLIPAYPVASPFKTLTVAPAGDLTSIPASPSGGFGLADLVFVLYGLGVLFFLLRFGLQLANLRRVVRTHGIRRLRGVKIVAVERLFSPFSFFNIIFLNPGPSLDADLRRILAHEQVHIRQQHSLDVLLMELVLSLQWFNPFVWPYKKALQETHEYLADSEVIAQGFSSVRYQLHMFEQHVGASLFEFGNNFKKSQIKRRIMMLSKIKSPRSAKLKLLLALPLVAGLVLTFAEPRLVAGTSASQETVLSEHQAQEKATQAEMEYEKLVAMEKDLRKQMETAPNDAAKKELALKLEMVLHKRQELAGLKMEYEKHQGVGPSEFSTDELKVMAHELQAKEAAVLAEYEKTTDESKKAELKKLLMKIEEKKEFLEMEYAKAKGGGPSEFSIDETKRILAELQAKESDARKKLESATDPGEKAKLEDFLKKIRQKQETLKMEYEKAMAAKSAKAEKNVK